MYDALRQEVAFEINFIDWPTYQNEKSFKAVAKRIIAENSICKEDVIGGSSLGGMVAIEIAKIIKPRGLVLIGSALYPNEIQSMLMLLSPFAAITPISLIQTLVGKHKHIVSQMFAESQPEFIRAMCQYLPSWNGCQGDQVEVFRLHGKKDHVIPCPASGCEVIDGAGHLIAYTHARATAVFLEKIRLQVKPQRD